MTSPYDFAAAMLLCCASVTACSQYNPAFDPSSADEATTEVGSDTIAATETGADVGTETGTDVGTDNATETDTGTDAPLCGNGILEAGEVCDDNNALNDDGCLANCQIPATCADILEYDGTSLSGIYRIDPGHTGTPWPVVCDMEFEGGGWTGFAVTDTCNGNLASVIEPIWVAETEGIDDSCRIHTEFAYGGAFGYTWDILFPPGFEAFFLREYQVKAIGTPELKLAQTVWSVPAVFPDGALSFGNAHDDGPVANWVTDGGTPLTFPEDGILPYPLQDHPFAIGKVTDTLRIGWGERGTMQREGLYPWWEGRIFLR